MDIRLDSVSKKFGKNWIFKKLNLNIGSGEHLAIMGANASGKTSLLKTIGGLLSPTEGHLCYHHNSRTIKPDELYRYTAFAAPWMDLPEDLTVKELYDFYLKLKTWPGTYADRNIPASAMLTDSLNKKVGALSSGKKQRLKLCLAIGSTAPLLLLDEPCSHLDQQGKAFYREMIAGFTTGRTVIVCSNHDEDEIYHCQTNVLTESFLPA